MEAPPPADFFALLGEARRPGLDPERVKDTFHRLSREQHPDAAAGSGHGDGGEDFARLNQAQGTLRDPRARLRHLLELEYPEVRVAGPAVVPGALADLFAPVLTLLREIDALLAKKAAAPSVLAKALLARQEWTLREAAETLLEKLDDLHAAALEELRTFDAAWEPRPPDAAARLVDFHGRFAYLSRWTEQLRERLFELGM